MIRDPEVGEIISSPVLIISFPVLKISFELLGENEEYLVLLDTIEFYYQRPVSGRINSNFCLDKSISCFEKEFCTPSQKSEIFCKISLLIRGLEVEKIILFPVLKINFFPLIELRNKLSSNWNWGLL